MLQNRGIFQRSYEALPKSKLEGGLHDKEDHIFLYHHKSLHSLCYAGDPATGYGTLIAVEFKANNKFNQAVGKLEYSGESIDIVSFTEGVAGIGIIALPQVCFIIEKTIKSKGVHHIKGRNQNGTIASGTINFRDQIKPKITFITDGGIVITNISTEGKDWQKKHIPNMVLGQ